MTSNNFKQFLKENIIYISLIILIFIGILVGSFFDLEINQAIYLKNNIFSLTLASFGEIPTYGGLALMGGIIFSQIKKVENKISKTILYIVSIFMMLFSIYYQGKAFTSVNAWGALFPNIEKLWISLIIGTIIITPIFILGILSGKKLENPKALKSAITIAIFLGAGLAIFTIIKPIFHRPRFRYLEAINDYSLFHKWYQPCENYKSLIIEGFTSEEFKSFPSGHTCSAFGAYLLLPSLTYFFPKLESKKKVLTIVGISWGFIVGFSRILCGAHYLSDVSFGLLIMFICTFFCNKLLKVNVN